MDCSPPGSSIQGIFHARILKWVAVSFSRGSSPPRDQTCISSVVSCFGRRILYHWATWEVCIYTCMYVLGSLHRQPSTNGTSLSPLAPVIFVLKTFVTSRVSRGLSHAQTRRLSFHQAASTNGLLHSVIHAHENPCARVTIGLRTHRHTLRGLWHFLSDVNLWSTLTLWLTQKQGKMNILLSLAGRKNHYSHKDSSDLVDW